MKKQEVNELRNLLKSKPRDAYLLRKLGFYYLRAGLYKQAKEEYSLAARFNPRLSAYVLLDYERILYKDPANIQARLSLGSFCLSLDEIETTVLELEEIIDIAPLSTSVYNTLGKIYIQLEKRDEALALLEKALSLGVKDVAISEMLARVYLEKGRLNEAIKFYEEILTYTPQDKKILRILGELYTRISDYNSAADKFGAMFSDDPEVSAECIKKLKDLLDKDPENILIKNILADVYLRSLKPEKAVKHYCDIVHLNGAKTFEVIDKLKKILKTYPSHPETMLSLAEILIEHENYSEAIELFRKLKNFPSFTATSIEGCKKIIVRYFNQVLAHQLLAEIYLDQENYKEAIVEFLEILKIHTEAADWVIDKSKDLIKKEPLFAEPLGYAYLTKENFSRANSQAEKLLSTNRRSAPAYILLGEIFLQQKLCRKALEAFHTALEIDPYNINLHKRFKVAKEKELALEITKIKKRLALDEWKISLHLDLAKSYLAKEEKEDARRELQIALRDQGRAPFIYQILGNLYREDGRYDLAVSAYKKGLEASSTDLIELNKKLKYSLGLTYEAQGQIKKALNIFEQLLEQDIDFPSLDKKINFLKRSNLASIQNKLLLALIAEPEQKKIAGMWGREQKTKYKKRNLTAPLGQNYNVAGFDYFIKAMYQAAEDEFSLSVQLDPNSIVGLNNLGVTFLVNNRFEEALFKFRFASEHEPNSAIIYNNLGVTYAFLGAGREAAKHLRKATEINSELAAAWINLGDVFYYSFKDAKGAIEAYKKIPSFDLLANIATKRLRYKIP